MDYIGNKCPVCDEYFHANDDIVVCPECGTPHHRECYNEIGKCANFDKHTNGFDYQENITNNTENDDSIITCKNCGAKNSDSAFFCTHCHTPLHEQQSYKTQTNNSQNNPYGASPFGASPQGQNPNIIMFDPLAGVSPNTDLGEGITAGETAKFVKQNTPYFITIFNNINKFSKSRFNFCAMLFGGGYLLFRKMYKIGSIITAIQTAMIILYFYLDYYIASSNSYKKIFDALSKNDYNAYALYLSDLSGNELLIILLFAILAFMILIMGIVIGCCANRMYYKHCKKQITKIKHDVENPKECSEILTKKGGVNLLLGISLWVTYIILSYMPIFFS